MKLYAWLRVVLIAAACAPALATAQEVAGRVLVSAGDVTLLRGGRILPGPRGADVQAGDTVRVGAASNAQVRFSDDSIVALRPDTAFQVREYQYQGFAPEAQRAIFGLITGGMRTVTGLIGKVRRENYAVNTPTATIGVRGTNYTLVQCDNNCRGPNGALAANGTYGAVTDGRIGVVNQSGERQFGANQFFLVGSVTAAPQQLIAPPSFLRDSLEGRRAAASGTQQAGTQQGGGTASTASSGSTSSSSAGSQSASTVAQTGLSGGTGDTSVTTGVTGAAILAVPPVTIVPVSTAAGTAGGLASLLASATVPTFFRLTGSSLNITLTSCGNPPCQLTAGDFTLAVNPVTGKAGLQANFQVISSTSSLNTFNVGTPFNLNGIPVTINGSQITFSGTVNLADYPNQQGSFRCDGCGSGSGPAFLGSISVSGTISGSSATLTFTGQDQAPQTGGGSFTITLTEQAPPNSTGAAYVVPTQGGGASAHSAAYWAASMDAAGKLISAGPTVGTGAASVGSATNTIAGSAPVAGNLVWGAWSSGAHLTDSNYNTYTSTSGLPWVTGNVTSVLPTSLGTVTYSPVGWVVNPNSAGVATGVLNSALLTVDFVNRDVSVNINATNPTSGNTFQMNGGSNIGQGAARFGAGFSSVTCSGPCGSGPGGSFSGFLAGPNAEGAGVAFTAGFGTNGGVSGAIGMKR